MGIRVALSHQSRYRYDRPVKLGPQVIRLRPASHCPTPISQYSLRVTPSPQFLNWQQDLHSNHLARIVLGQETSQLAIDVNLIVEMVAFNPFEFLLEPAAEIFPFEYETSLRQELGPFLQTEYPGRKLSAYLSSINRTPRNTISFLVDLNADLKEKIEYHVRSEPGIQTCEQTLELHSGSCRDFAWLLLQLLRNLGVAARFVSGYLVELTGDSTSVRAALAHNKDTCSLHAWVEVYLPGAGWIGLDPTSGLMAGAGHIPLACSPDPTSAAPISGTVETIPVQFDVSMSVTRIGRESAQTPTGLEPLQVDRMSRSTIDDNFSSHSDNPNSISDFQVQADSSCVATLDTIPRVSNLRLSKALTQPGMPRGLLDDYVARVDTYDDVRTPLGTMRPAWQPLANELTKIRSDEFTRLQRLSQRIIHEDGFDFETRSSNDHRRQQLGPDAVPLMMSSQDYRAIADGLEQRARLLNLILADLFGPQDLIKDGALPAEFLFANPAFLRPYHGLPAAGAKYLHSYAADLVRSSDGQFRVIADRTDDPSGVGYSLENRLVVSRILPDAIQKCHVERLAPFFMTLQESVRQLAPRYHDNLRIVVLSQGPKSASYFEDAYLARYLGYTLVEGGDLTVRDDRVLLKTLGGLLPVEVILRRVASELCDPLELNSESSFGVAGLLQAIRSGNVVVANSLGSGLVESPMLMSFLPTLCQRLLGESLKVPSVKTWWCHIPDDRQHVLEHLDQLIVKSAYRLGNQAAWDRRIVDMPAKQLAAEISASPENFVAQERLRPSSAPVWNNGRFESWNATLRMHIVASGGDYETMTGGLARVWDDAESTQTSVSCSYRSKDVWVLSDGPVRYVSLLPNDQNAIELRRGGAQLPSRVADNLFWLGRHAERAEGAARLLRTVLLRLTSESEVDSIPELPVLLRALADQGQIETGFAILGIKDQLPDIKRALPTFVFDEAEPFGLRHTVTELLRLASMVRDRISLDCWRIVCHLDQQFQRSATNGIDSSDLLVMLNQLLNNLAAFGGQVMGGMIRSQGWRFLDLGRRIERIQHTTHLIRNTLVDVVEDERPVLDAILEIIDSRMTYRVRYLARLQVAPVLDLLLTDETNPRSIAAQLVALTEHVENLPSDGEQSLRTLEQRLTMAARHSVEMADVDILCEMQLDGQRQNLERLLARLAQQLPTLSETITNKYLFHASAPRQMERTRAFCGKGDMVTNSK